MNVKGTAYVTGKVTIIAAFGEDRWNAFNARLAAKDKFFSNMIMSVTPIPVEKHILFLDELLKEFFNNDANQYFMFGKVAAKFALSPGGPYNAYLLTKDIKQFVESGMPKLWSTYFDGGSLTGRFENNIVHLKITGIPIKHVYYEYMVMGYFQQALKMFGKKTVENRVRSFASGDDEIYYKYEIKNT
jgi:hypothetical protein